jgi:hypothetical protein
MKLDLDMNMTIGAGDTPQSQATKFHLDWTSKSLRDISVEVTATARVVRTRVTCMFANPGPAQPHGMVPTRCIVAGVTTATAGEGSADLPNGEQAPARRTASGETTLDSGAHGSPWISVAAPVRDVAGDRRPDPVLTDSLQWLPGTAAILEACGARRGSSSCRSCSRARGVAHQSSLRPPPPRTRRRARMRRRPRHRPGCGRRRPPRRLPALW